MKEYATGLRIIIILLAAVIGFAAVFSYASDFINDYYSTASDDVFSATMEVEKVYSCEDSNVLVCGTFYQGDNIIDNQSVFVKSYKEDGTVNEVSSISVPKEYCLSDILTYGNSMVLMIQKEDNTSGEAYIYNITSGGYLCDNIDISMELDTCKTIEFFPGLKEDGSLVYAALRGDNRIIVKDSTETLCDFYVSDDFEVCNVDVFDGLVAVSGSILYDGNYVSYCELHDYTGEVKGSAKAMESKTSRFIGATKQSDGSVVFLGVFADDKIYIPEASDILIENEFATDPWCSYFATKLNSSGEVETSASIFTADQSFGIVDFEFLSNDSENFGFGVSKNATDTEADSYNIAIYDANFSDEDQKSAVISIPCDNVAYFTKTSDNGIIAYYGLLEDSGLCKFTLQKYDSAETAVTELKKLELCKKYVKFMSKLLDSEFIFVVFVVLFLYTTVRVKNSGEIFTKTKKQLH